MAALSALMTPSTCQKAPPSSPQDGEASTNGFVSSSYRRTPASPPDLRRVRSLPAKLAGIDAGKSLFWFRPKMSNILLPPEGKISPCVDKGDRNNSCDTQVAAPRRTTNLGVIPEQKEPDLETPYLLEVPSLSAISHASSTATNSTTGLEWTVSSMCSEEEDLLLRGLFLVSESHEEPEEGHADLEVIQSDVERDGIEVLAVGGLQESAPCLISSKTHL